MARARLADGGDAGNAGILGRDMRTGAGAAFHRVDIDEVGSALHRHAHVVIDARGAELQLDRDFPIGRLADLLDLEREIVGSEPIGMARRRALVDAGGQRAHLGHLVGHLLPHQMAAKPDLAALADEELARVGEPQMMRVEAVARLDALIEPLRSNSAARPGSCRPRPSRWPNPPWWRRARARSSPRRTARRSSCP